MSDISRAAAYDDVYKLTELSVRHSSDPVKLAKIAEAMEESIPTLDPVRFRGELEHVLQGPDLPELERAKEMAKAALEGRPVEGAAEAGASPPAPTMRGLLGFGALFGRRPSRPRD
jgi:hypothetical protein